MPSCVILHCDSRAGSSPPGIFGLMCLLLGKVRNGDEPFGRAGGYLAVAGSISRAEHVRRRSADVLPVGDNCVGQSVLPELPYDTPFHLVLRR